MSFSTRRRARHERFLQIAVAVLITAMTIHLVADAWFMW
jgi:hypothetical protein